MSTRRRWTLGAHLLAFGVLLLLPTLGVGAASAWDAVLAYKAASEARLRDTAKAIATALDSEFDAFTVAAAALAASPVLRSAEPAAVQEMRGWADEIADALGGVRIIINDAAPGHRQLLNTGIPKDARLPPPSPPGGGASELIQRVIETSRPAVSNLYARHPSNTLSVAVAAPVVYEGQVIRVVVVGIEPRRLSRLLVAQGWGGNAIATATDGTNRIVARSNEVERFVGSPTPSWYVATQGVEDGIFRGDNAEGVPSLFGFHRLRNAPGWGVVVGQPLSTFDAVWQRPVIGFTIGATLVLCFAALCAIVLTRRILAPLTALRQQAAEVTAGRADRTQPFHLSPTSILEFEALRTDIGRADEALRAIGTAERTTATALRASEARLERAVAAAHMATWEWEASTGQITGSPGREALYGRQPNSLATREALLAAVHPDDRDRLSTATEAELATGAPYAVDFRTIWPDGTIHWLRTQGRTELDVIGRPLRISGIVMDIDAQKATEERQKLLAHELDHRARNALAVVQAALRLTPKDDVKNFAKAVEGRVTALARAHTLLAAAKWTGADLASLVRGELATFLVDDVPGSTDRKPRVEVMHGQTLTLNPGGAQALSMALHELATNALKYGALSISDGRLVLSWSIDAAGQMLRLRWAETASPLIIAPPQRRGFGSRVVEATIEDQLGGRVSRVWAASGLTCDIELPLSRVIAHAS